MRNYEIDTLSVFEAGDHTEKQAMDSKNKPCHWSTWISWERRTENHINIALGEI